MRENLTMNLTMKEYRDADQAMADMYERARKLRDEHHKAFTEESLRALFASLGALGFDLERAFDCAREAEEGKQ